MRGLSRIYIIIIISAVIIAVAGGILALYLYQVRAPTESIKIGFLGPSKQSMEMQG